MQITKCEVAVAGSCARRLEAAFGEDIRLPATDGSFELDFFLADPMRFVPVELCFADRTISQPNRRNAFHLPPYAATVLPTQPSPIAQTRSGCDCFGRPNWTEYLEVHVRSLAYAG
jgi:hypothetical protein